MQKKYHLYLIRFLTLQSTSLRIKFQRQRVPILHLFFRFGRSLVWFLAQSPLFIILPIFTQTLQYCCFLNAIDETSCQQSIQTQRCPKKRRPTCLTPLELGAAARWCCDVSGAAMTSRGNERPVHPYVCLSVRPSVWLADKTKHISLTLIKYILLSLKSDRNQSIYSK